MSEHRTAQRELLEAAKERAAAIVRLQKADDALMEAVRKLEKLEANQRS